MTCDRCLSGRHVPCRRPCDCSICHRGDRLKVAIKKHRSKTSKAKPHKQRAPREQYKRSEKERWARKVRAKACVEIVAAPTDPKQWSSAVRLSWQRETARLEKVIHG